MEELDSGSDSDNVLDYVLSKLDVFVAENTPWRPRKAPADMMMPSRRLELDKLGPSLGGALENSECDI
jgi:hypothetical protein